MKEDFGESQPFRLYYMIGSAFTVMLFQFPYCSICKGIPGQ